MSALYTTGSKPVKYPFKHDPDEKKYYSFSWGADARISNYEYLLDDIVAPATANGFYYVCTSPGRSHATTEPTWSTTIDGTTTDGTVKWQTVPYNLLLRRGDTFTSTWTPSTGITVDNPGLDTTKAWVRVTAVPSGATSFTLTNHVTITRIDGKVEEYDRTMTVTVTTL